MQTHTSHPTRLAGARLNALHSYPWLMLISRSTLFIFFQLLIALILMIAGDPSVSNAFQESARWWTFMAFLANFASIYLLVRVFKAEGKHYWEQFI
jgi:hypothetical protein